MFSHKLDDRDEFRQIQQWVCPACDWRGEIWELLNWPSKRCPNCEGGVVNEAPEYIEAIAEITRLISEIEDAR